MLRYFLLFVVLCFISPVQAGEWNSNIAGEWLVFTEDAADPATQEDSYLSAAIETEYFHEWNDGNDIFTFKPFLRIDQHDASRAHGDIRELSWIHAEGDWEILTGISKVYWGATEAAHLVDIINQTDLVENLDGEDKLGQPMIKLTSIKDWGVFDFFVLPGFRERTFPSINGRPRTAPIVDTNLDLYFDDGIVIGDITYKHIDYAVRWSDTLGDWDIGLSYFNGVSREPRLLFGGGVLTPNYDNIGQIGLDVQSAIESWLFKLETISRSGQGNHFLAAATGIEYTFVGINESQIDMGIIVEYLYDERNMAPFQNDLVLGARFAMNDAESSELLISAIFDLEGDGQNFNIEGSSRIGDDMKISIEARGVANLENTSVLKSFEKDNRVRTEVTYYF